jgi:hypothetical protein
VFGNHTAFVKVRQKDLSWCLPIEFEIRPPLQLISPGTQDADHLRFRLRNNTARAIDQDVMIRCGSQAISAHIVAAPGGGDSNLIALSAAGILPGTNPVTVRLSSAQSVTSDMINWQIVAHDARFEQLDLASACNDRVTRIFTNDYLSPRSLYCSLSIPKNGMGGWCDFDLHADIDDAGLRNHPRITLPNGVPFTTVGAGGANNILFTSQWDNYPKQASIALAGRSSHVYLLMAGSTGPMQSRITNGEVTATYADGSSRTLRLENPTTWWPIEQDYFIDDYGFARPEPIPPRVDLKTAAVRMLQPNELKTTARLTIPGGAATVLDLPLDDSKELKSLTVRAVSNDVVIGLMAVTLSRAAAVN